MSLYYIVSYHSHVFHQIFGTFTVFNSQDRTNNHSEAVNRRLNVEMGECHPSIWVFINCLRIIRFGHDYFYSQLAAGKSPHKKFKKIADLDRRILKIVQQYVSRDYFSYLKSIVYNISLSWLLITSIIINVTKYRIKNVIFLYSTIIITFIKIIDMTKYLYCINVLLFFN